MNNSIYRVKLIGHRHRVSLLVQAKKFLKNANDQITGILGPYRMTSFDGKKCDLKIEKNGCFLANDYSFRLLKRNKI